MYTEKEKNSDIFLDFVKYYNVYCALVIKKNCQYII